MLKGLLEGVRATEKIMLQVCLGAPAAGGWIYNTWVYFLPVALFPLGAPPNVDSTSPCC